MDKYICPFCNEQVDPKQLHTEFQIVNEGITQKVGCPKCGTYVDTTETWQYIIAARNVEAKMVKLITLGMDKKRLLNRIKEIKDLNEAGSYFGDILRLYEKFSTEE